MQQEKAKKKHVFAVHRLGSTPILANTGEDSTCPTQMLGVGGGANSTLLFYSVKTSLFVGNNHGLINYKDTKTNRLYGCLIEFIEWRYSQSCWYFRPPFKINVHFVQFIQTVWGLEGGGGGVLCCVGDHILQEFNTLFLTRFRTYKIALPPQTKT